MYAQNADMYTPQKTMNPTMPKGMTYVMKKVYAPARCAGARAIMTRMSPESIEQLIPMPDMEQG